MDEILLIGAGGHARACIDVIEQQDKFKIVGLIEKEKTEMENCLGYPIVGIDSDLVKLRKNYEYALITIGQINSPEPRKKLYRLLKKLDFKLPVIKSPLSYVSKHANVIEGTIIMHGSVVNANAKIGRNCIINNQSLIEHDAVIDDNCHIATGAIINGEVEVGEGTFIGSGVVTKQCISIGNNCVIGAGIVVKRNIKPDQVIKN
jgi:sugar O-acyltransferase (sialic acid O-acetyltransferase NeuD family)